MLLQPSIFMTPFHRAEVAHAIFNQVFRGRMTTSQARDTFQDFEEDCSIGIWRQAQLPIGIFDSSAAMARRHAATLGVRTLDSMHVAAALELRADLFWTFDVRQRKLAEAEGLATE